MMMDYILTKKHGQIKILHIFPTHLYTFHLYNFFSYNTNFYYLFAFSCFLTEMCYLSNDIYDYHNVSQGKVTIPNVDDAEELLLTDVRIKPQKICPLFVRLFYKL